MKTLEVEVKGPGSGRESALRALQAVGFTITVDPRRDADPAQRLPPAQAPPRLSELQPAPTRPVYRPPAGSCPRMASAGWPACIEVEPGESD